MFWVVYVVTFILLVYLFIRYIKSLKVEGFHEKYVFITGCDTGFGRELVIRLDNMGFHVFAGCLTANGRVGLEKRCSPRLVTLQLNVTSEDSIQDALATVRDNLPPEKGLWAVVNNAGVFGNLVTAEMLEKKDYMTTLEVNLLGPIQIIKTFLPLVRKGQGRLVTMTSITGRYPMAGGPYCISKSALEAYLDVLRKEIYTQGIPVSMIEPGGVQTNLMDSVNDHIHEAVSKASDELKAVYGQDYLDSRLKGAKFIKVLPTQASHVVDTYVKALTERYPQTRYVVGYDAKFLFLPLSYLPDKFGDWLIHKCEKIAIYMAKKKWV